MTLDQIAATKGGVGFFFKSLATGKVFKALTKSPGGGYVAQKVVGGGNGEELLLKGDADRYDVAPTPVVGPTAKEVLSTKLAALQTQIDDANVKMDDLSDQIEAWEAEAVDVEQAINDLG
jgi:hypothetical protein